MSLNVAAAIPAKGSSSRVPFKNLERIRGVPLFLWAANNLSRVLPQDRIHVDSDCEEILGMARCAGFPTIRRPAELATNAATGNDLMLWQASQIEADVLIQHLPPMIFLRPQTIRAALSYIEEGLDSVFGAHAEQVYAWSDQGPCYDVKALPNSFTLPTRFREGMGFYASRKQALERERVRICGKHRMVLLDEFEQIDIDTPGDLEFARTLAAGLSADDPLLEGLSRLLPASRIKLIVCDVDGCLTDGRMVHGESGEEMKFFHTRDGIAVQQARSAGIEVAFLSNGFTTGHIEARAARLGVKRVAVSREPKAAILKSWMQELGLQGDEVAYLGDDVNDIEAMRLCGLTACPADAHPAVKQVAAAILATPGGKGALRDFWDNHFPPA